MREPCHCGCTCGCCEGVEALTPLDTANRPGLDALHYRAGTHSSFLETMQARLSSKDRPELAGLTTREESDPSVALLDAWATVGDVLTFYQERIANEGYLRTATERRSVRELARLIGYELRPGVAASTWLAFTLDPGPEVVIPAGSRAQSVPSPGELPQPFETSTKLVARAAWNQLPVRRTRPQLGGDVLDSSTLYLQGIATQLKPNDPLLIRTEEDQKPGLYRVRTVEPDAKIGRTKVTFEPWEPIQAGNGAAAVTPVTEESGSAFLAPSLPGENATAPPADDGIDVILPEVFAANPKLLDKLGQEPSSPPSSPQRLPRDPQTALDPGSDAAARLLLATRPELREVLYPAWQGVPVTRKPVLEVWALRLRASVFGHNAPLELIRREDGVITGTQEWELETAIDGEGGGEFRFGLQFETDSLGRRQRVRFFISLDDKEVTFPPIGQPPLPLFQPAHATINVPGRDPVVLDILPEEQRILLFCKKRELRVSIDLGSGIQVVTEGADPNTVEIAFQEGDDLSVSGRIPTTISREDEFTVHLDSAYPQILPASWIVLERPTPLELPATVSPLPLESRLVITTANRVSEGSRSAYGIAGKSTRVELADRWLRLQSPTPDTFAVIRGTAVHAHSELLELAEMPIQQAVGEGDLELAGLFDGLEPGRWLIVTGERADLEVPSPEDSAPKVALPGVRAAELVMVAEVRQGLEDRPGEQVHTTLVLASRLAYRYRRDTIEVWGNVAPATHGETKSEILGSGRASEPLQRFTLKQAPLTHVSAPTPSGIESTLRVRVNDVLWHEAPSLFGLTPTDHAYTTRTDEEGATTVVFGDGRRGARPQTGSENIRAVYRVGIGKPGNLAASRITQLVTRPLGVKEVTNPLPATGGANAESRDQARRNAPLAVMALDRLVSVQDYADFARTFAGIGRASATRISNGRSQVVHVTVAGEDDIPIAVTSELFRNLESALRRFGDPHLPVRLAVREVFFLRLVAGVQLLPDDLWEAVAPKIRASLLDALGFERRDLAQSARLGEAIAAIQRVPGVAYVDVDLFRGVTTVPRQPAGPASGPPRPGPIERIRALPARRDPKTGEILPAQLVYLPAAVSELILLKEIPS